MIKKRSLIKLWLICIISIFLGVGSLWRLIKEIYWVYSGQHPYFPWQLILGVIFSLGLIISVLLALKLKNWARVLFLSLMALNLFSTLIVYAVIENRIPLGNFVHTIYPLASFRIMTDCFLWTFDKEIPFPTVIYWLQFSLSIGFPIFVIFYLTRPKVKEQFK